MLQRISQIELALWLFTTVACIVLAFRIFFLGLHRVYRYFFGYLVFSSCRSLILWQFNPNTAMYSWIWVLTEPAIWVFYVLVVIEIYELALTSHQGIYSFGRWMMMAALGGSALLAVFSVLLTWHDPGGPSPILHYITAIERAVDFCLVIFLLLIIAFLSRFPVRLTRNMVVHCVVYTIFFIASTVIFIAGEIIAPNLIRILSTCLLGVSATSVLAWLLLLTRRGETRRSVPMQEWRPGDEERLLEQLESINSTLVGAGKNQR
jgi:hypothetical protein